MNVASMSDLAATVWTLKGQFDPINLTAIYTKFAQLASSKGEVARQKAEISRMLADLEEPLLEALPSLAPRSLAAVLWGHAKAGEQPSARFWHEYEMVVGQGAGAMSGRELALVVSGYQRLGRVEAEVLGGLAEVVALKVDELHLADVAAIAQVGWWRYRGEFMGGRGEYGTPRLGAGYRGVWHKSNCHW